MDYRAGDYRVVAQRLRPAAERLVERCAPGAGDVVVDIGAGSGNVALLCAQRGASVVAVDRVPEQLLLGREDAAGGVHWVAGDAAALPLADESATAALSTFALIYVSDPDAAVRELARVTRPGATLGLTAWSQGAYQAESVQVFLASGALDLDGHDALEVWGSADRIAARLEPVADDVEVTEHALVGRFASLDAWWEQRLRTPPVMTARQRLDDAAFDELARRLREVAAAHATVDDDGFALHDPYLLAHARRR